MFTSGTILARKSCITSSRKPETDTPLDWKQLHAAELTSISAHCCGPADEARCPQHTGQFATQEVVDDWLETTLDSVDSLFDVYDRLIPALVHDPHVREMDRPAHS